MKRPIPPRHSICVNGEVVEMSYDNSVINLYENDMLNNVLIKHAGYTVVFACAPGAQAFIDQLHDEGYRTLSAIDARPAIAELAVERFMRQADAWENWLLDGGES